MTPEEWPPGTVLVCVKDHYPPYLYNNEQYLIRRGDTVMVKAWLNVRTRMVITRVSPFPPGMCYEWGAFPPFDLPEYYRGIYEV